MDVYATIRNKHILFGIYYPRNGLLFEHLGVNVCIPRFIHLYLDFVANVNSNGFHTRILIVI